MPVRKSRRVKDTGSVYQAYTATEAECRKSQLETQAYIEKEYPEDVCADCGHVHGSGGDYLRDLSCTCIRKDGKPCPCRKWRKRAEVT